MRARVLLGWLLATCLAAPMARAQAIAPAPSTSRVVVFWEEGLPAADSAAPVRAQLEAQLPHAAIVNTQQLSEALRSAETRLLVLPYGSVFPEEQWPAIQSYLERGGNLFVLGGQAFTRPAYREDHQWKLRPATLAYAQKLFINAYQATPGSQGLEFRRNEDFAFLDLPAFDWATAWSLKVRLSDEDLNPRSGSGGTIDARLDALVWGERDARRLSAPLVQIDHLENSFAGGRWVFLACHLPVGFYDGAAASKLIPALARQTISGAEEFSVRPSWPVFLPGEPVTLQMRWQALDGQPVPARLEFEVVSDAGRAIQKQVEFTPGGFPYHLEIPLPPAEGKGLHVVTARLMTGGAVRSISHTGYWLRDADFLRSGPRVWVNKAFFEVDGKPQLIVGTTYMASDVQRQFFMQPNPYVWDRDVAELRAAGFNMLRTGWWTAWDQITGQPGVVHEEMMRAFEAYLLTARKYGLPVQFSFFAFTPEVLGGRNPYLDPEALRRQKELILAVVSRFKDVPWLMWDLINEPSFDNPGRLWSLRPNGDAAELRAWNAWLKEKYKDRGALAEAWNTTPVPEDEPVPVPREDEFSPRAVYGTMRGANSLRVHDFYLFAQQQFLNWVRELRGAIRATGSRQLITVGQDEAGVRDGLNPSFFSEALDFTSMHPWWQLDALLWDALTAKQPGKALLEQEVGVTRQLRIDGTSRRSMEDEAALLERKMAIALATGTGAIHWLWNINSYMRDDNEVSIGAVRPDRTEKPEGEVLRRFAEFAARAGAPAGPPETPEVAIVTSQALQFSALNHLALDAQMKALRALEYACRVPAYVIAENQIANLGAPKLVVLPSPQALSEETWQALLRYVSGGGQLLVTGSMERDPNWKMTQRLAALGVQAAPRPLNYRTAELSPGAKKIALAFNAEVQEFIDALELAGGDSYREIAWGKGRIYLISLPVELAEGGDAAAELYAFVLEHAGLKPPFDGRLPSPGVLIHPVFFADRVLYLFVSESAREEEIDLRDLRTGAQIHFRLPSLRSRLIVVRRADGKVLAEYRR
jgi:hypothetical protein